MQIIKQVVGIDVSKDSLTVRFGTMDTDQQKNISTAVNFTNDLKGHKELLSWSLKQRQTDQLPLWFTMEATGVYYENLAFFLTEQKQQIAVILPNKTKYFAKTLQTKSKTDSIDAESLTHYGLEKPLKNWQVSPEIMRTLKSLCREYRSLKAKKVEINNQLHAKENSYKPLKSSIRRLNQQLNLISRQQEQIISEIKNLVDKDKELKDKIDRIDKIQGVGFITIVTVIAETNGFALIENQKQLTSYAGLDVVHRQSGLKTGKTTISKKGNKHLRQSVYMPALAASRYNHKLKELYTRLAIKKNNKKVALIAVARKLLLLIYTIWKTDQKYDPFYNHGKSIAIK